jgi:hypothetical protein
VLQQLDLLAANSKGDTPIFFFAAHCSHTSSPVPTYLPNAQELQSRQDRLEVAHEGLMRAWQHEHRPIVRSVTRRATQLKKTRSRAH